MRRGVVFWRSEAAGPKMNSVGEGEGTRMRGFLIRAVVVAIGLWVASQIIPGVEIRSPSSLIAAALLLGVVNAVIRPIIVILTLPITLLTLGLFLLVINGLMIELVAHLLDGFVVSGFWNRDALRDRRQHHELADVRLHRIAGPHRGRHGEALRPIRLEFSVPSVIASSGANDASGCRDCFVASLLAMAITPRRRVREVEPPRLRRTRHDVAAPFKARNRPFLAEAL